MGELVHALEDAWEAIGCTMTSPFMTMGLIPLACIPDLRLTDRGRVDCTTFEFVDLRGLTVAYSLRTYALDYHAADGRIRDDALDRSAVRVAQVLQKSSAYPRAPCDASTTQNS